MCERAHYTTVCALQSPQATLGPTGGAPLNCLLPLFGSKTTFGGPKGAPNRPGPWREAGKSLPLPLVLIPRCNGTEAEGGPAAKGEQLIQVIGKVLAGLFSPL